MSIIFVLELCIRTRKESIVDINYRFLRFHSFEKRNISLSLFHCLLVLNMIIKTYNLKSKRSKVTENCSG